MFLEETSNCSAWPPPCSQRCDEESTGGVTCSCERGYLLEADGHHCAAEVWRGGGGFLIYDQGADLWLKALETASGEVERSDSFRLIEGNPLPCIGAIGRSSFSQMMFLSPPYRPLCVQFTATPIFLSIQFLKIIFNYCTFSSTPEPCAASPRLTISYKYTFSICYRLAFNLYK